MAGEKLTFTIRDDAPGGAPLLTIPGGIGLYRTRVALDLTLEVDHGLSANARFEGCFVRLGSGGDSFIEVLIPGAQESEAFDLGFTWDSQRGVSFSGGGALEVTLPLRAKLPIVQLHALHIVAKPADPNIAIELSADVKASLLDVIEVSVERIGVVANLCLGGPPPAGALPIGPLGATIDFKPPTGAGLSLDVAGVLSGGGFLSIDSAKGQYAGILAINLLGIGVTAIALINTRPTFSLLAIISADFKPVGIDISFGFTINAIGGLLGLHRSADLRALADGVRNNAIASIMFPPNPVADAPRILSDLERMFPVVQNQFLIGPMIELGWGKPAGMISLALGLIIEVPDPKFAILGILKVLVPPGMDAAPLRIQVNFIGSVDVGQRFLRFDASLYDSRLITYALDGDMAARLRWGAGANFAVTVGGFNPHYVPAADLEIGNMRRVSINLLPTEDNPRLRIDSYYAVTSNTLQHGARIELYAAAAGFGVRGFLGYDVLVQLSPLHFDAAFGGEVAVIAGDEDIMSVGLNLRLQGPSPWQVDGEAKFKVLIVKVTIPVHATFGSSDAPAVPDIDVAEKFRDQIKSVPNWSAALPGQNQLLVQLKPKLAVARGEVLAHPSATIAFNQNAVPLKVALQRFGAGKPRDVNFFDLVGMSAGADLVTEPMKNEFAPAQFFDLTDDQKISAPAFREFDSGLRANGAALVRFTKFVPRDFGYENSEIDAVAQEGPPWATSLTFDVSAANAVAFLGGGALANSPLYRERLAGIPTGDEITFKASGYRIVDAATLTVTGGALDNHIAADQALAQMVAASPGLAGTLIVVPEHELV